MKKVDIVNNKRVCVLIALVVMVFVVFVGFCGFGGRGCGFFGGFGDSRGVGEVVFPVVSPVPAGFDVGRVSNIVFTADSGYVDYLRVALRSVLDNRAEGSYYNIYVLGVDLSDEDRRVLEGYSGGRVRVSVVEVNSALIKNIKTNAKYSYRVSRADLFKFFIPQIFKDLDRVLYLDSDIIVMGDLSKVYNYNLEGRLVGVVGEKTNFENEDNSKFNCGVILFDIKKCLDNNLIQRLIISKSKDKTKRYLTQLAYTQALTTNEIKFLPKGFNYLIKENKNIEDINKKETTIIHYAGFKKPWYNPNMSLAQEWWNYALLVNPNQKVEKRTVYSCTMHSLVNLNANSKKNKLITFKKKYKECRGYNDINLPVVSPVPAGFDVGRVSNIVFTADSGYVDYLRVALRSVLDNRAEGSYYNIYVLGVDLSDEDRRVLEGYSGGRVRVSVINVSLKELKKQVKNTNNLFYISEADYFKFFIPEIFKDFNKILYLDSDILVLGDLTQLFNTNLEDKYIGVVKRYLYKKNIKRDAYNCGVILFNIEKFRKNNITQKLIEAKAKDKDGRSTQYSFNKVITVDDIKPLSPVYNNNAAMLNKSDYEKYDFKKFYKPYCDNIKNMDGLDNKTIIAHYIGYDKPWHSTSNLKFKDEWWEYAKKTNPKLTFTKRTMLERIKIAYSLTKRSQTIKTKMAYIKKFFTIFKKTKTKN